MPVRSYAAERPADTGAGVAMRMGCCAGAIHHSSGLRGSQERPNQLPGPPQSGPWLLEGASGVGTRGGTLDRLHMVGRQPGRRARPLAPTLPTMLLMTDGCAALGSREEKLYRR